MADTNFPKPRDLEQEKRAKERNERAKMRIVSSLPPVDRTKTLENIQTEGLEQKGADIVGKVEDVKSGITGLSEEYLTTPMAKSSQELDVPFPGTPPIEVPNSEGIKEITQKDPNARAALINGFAKTKGKKLSNKQFNEVDQLLQDEAKLQGKMEKSNPGVSALFTTALLGFLPTLVGAAFGGDEGGAIGAQVGLGAIKQVADEKEADRKAALEEKKFQLDTIKEQGLQSSRAAQLEQKTLVDMADINIRKAQLALEKTKQAFAEKTSGDKRTSEAMKAAAYGDNARNFNEIYESSIAEAIKNNEDPTSFNNAFKKFLDDNVIPSQWKGGIMEKNLRAAQIASEGLVSALLRFESGSAIGDKEYERKARELILGFGDNKDIALNKRISRELAVAGVQRAGGLKTKKELGDHLDQTIFRAKNISSIADLIKNEPNFEKKKQYYNSLSSEDRIIFNRTVIQGGK
ncbi:MAG TPA: hypothetical protein VIS27_09545 [Yeosuana sp.]